MALAVSKMRNSFQEVNTVHEPSWFEYWHFVERVYPALNKFVSAKTI